MTHMAPFPWLRDKKHTKPSLRNMWTSDSVTQPEPPRCIDMSCSPSVRLPTPRISLHPRPRSKQHAHPLCRSKIHDLPSCPVVVLDRPKHEAREQASRFLIRPSGLLDKETQSKKRRSVTSVVRKPSSLAPAPPAVESMHPTRPIFSVE